MIKNNNFLALIIITLHMVFSLTMNSSAQDGGAGQPGEFLRYGIDTRALGLGKAYTGFAQGASAIYWNPAGLIARVDNTRGFSVLTSMTNLYGFSNLNYFGIGVPLIEFTGLESESPIQREFSKWSVGIGYLSFSMGDFEYRDKDNVQVGSGIFEDKQSALFFSLARRVEIFSQKLDFGFSLKMIRHNLFGENANASSLDFGFLYEPNYHIGAIGLKIQDLNEPDLGFSDSQDDIIPLTSKLGFAIFPGTLVPSLGCMTILFDYDLIYPDQREKNWYLGTEISLFKIKGFSNVPAKIRFGINSMEERFSFGLSLDLPQNTFTSGASAYLPRLDWAYTSHSKTAFGNNSEQYGFTFNYTRFRSENFYNIAKKHLYFSSSITTNKSADRFLRLIDDTKLKKKKDYNQVEKYLRAALTAANPGRRAFPLAAQLRLGDLQLLKSENILNGLKLAFNFYQKAESLTGYSVEIDKELNQISYLNYIQSCLVNERRAKARALCSSEKVWDIHNTKRKDDDRVQYLLKLSSADSSLREKGQIGFDSNSIYFDLLLFTFAQKEIERGELKQAESNLTQLLQSQKQKMRMRNSIFILPDNIYLPFFSDGIMVDDVLILLAKIEETIGNNSSALNYYKKLVKYYPNTDHVLDALKKIKSVSSTK